MAAGAGQHGLPFAFWSSVALRRPHASSLPHAVTAAAFTETPSVRIAGERLVHAVCPTDAAAANSLCRERGENGEAATTNAALILGAAITLTRSALTCATGVAVLDGRTAASGGATVDASAAVVKREPCEIGITRAFASEVRARGG